MGYRELDAGDERSGTDGFDGFDVWINRYSDNNVLMLQIYNLGEFGTWVGQYFQKEDVG
jgi:hypothetical protein